MITLYQFATSPMCEKVRRILNHKGLAYELVEVDRARVADHAAVSPFGKFPAMLVDGVSVCDSTDIAHHLESAYPQRPLIPADSLLAAQVHVLEDWADESLYFYEITMRISWENNLRRNIRGFMATLPTNLTEEEAFERVLKGSQQLVATQGLGRKTRAQVVADASRHVRALAAMLSAGPFLVGGQLTLADIAVASQYGCLLQSEEFVAETLQYPQLAAWLARVDGLASPHALGGSAS